MGLCEQSFCKELMLESLRAMNAQKKNNAELDPIPNTMARYAGPRVTEWVTVADWPLEMVGTKVYSTPRTRPAGSWTDAMLDMFG